ncbi:CAAX farnesyltransferase (FTase) subunit beta [Tulasnella sp. UAMH 9824]|nr:CAAX farnesyltransferase (FTase) subunit beta [Tulasnella sp. UAMH 9824]
MTSGQSAPERRPQPTDGCATETSKSQAETEKSISQLFETIFETQKPITLARNNHLNWLIRFLVQGFPQRYISQDASQPWLLYFLLQSFQTLGIAFDPDTKKKAVKTILARQHPDGGFGGGPGQFAHLLATYPSVCALAIVGSPGPEGGWDQIDRQKMYRFFMSLKQPDGSFLVSRNGEVDVRGTYCLLAVATLLDLITPELVAGTYDFLRSCQTYEGGFSAASQPYFSPSTPPELLAEPRPYLGEAHGGYTSCAVASLMFLRPVVTTSTSHSLATFPGIDASNLLRWAAMMQGNAFEEGGGFRGRTNKLVDGCYSWWVGGLFPLIEEMLGEASGESLREGEDGKAGATEAEEDDWADADDTLFDKEALQRYTLIAAQQSTGGLRDKPTAPPDAYHTLYNLAGLSSAQHRVFLSKKRKEELKSTWVENEGFVPTKEPILEPGEVERPSSTAPGAPSAGDSSTLESDELRKIRRCETYAEALAWVEDEGASRYVGGEGNRVNATHPLFNLTMTSSRAVMAYFYKQV